MYPLIRIHYQIPIIVGFSVLDIPAFCHSCHIDLLFYGFTCIFFFPSVVCWLLSYYIDFAAIDEILHTCYIIDGEKVSKPSVSGIIEANK